MLRTLSIHKNEQLPEENPFSGILTAVAFAVRATVHTTTRATPTQIVFGKDAILNIRHQADWHFIKDRKEKLIKYNNTRENAKRLPYQYRV